MQAKITISALIRVAIVDNQGHEVISSNTEITLDDSRDMSEQIISALEKFEKSITLVAPKGPGLYEV